MIQEFISFIVLRPPTNATTSRRMGWMDRNMDFDKHADIQTERDTHYNIQDSGAVWAARDLYYYLVVPWDSMYHLYHFAVVLCGLSIYLSIYLKNLYSIPSILGRITQ